MWFYCKHSITLLCGAALEVGIGQHFHLILQCGGGGKLEKCVMSGCNGCSELMLVVFATTEPQAARWRAGSDHDDPVVSTVDDSRS